MRVGNRARWAFVIVVGAALVLAATAAARTHSAAKGPIVIGWAHDDSQGPMGPFDLPALAAAQIEINKINKKGRHGPQDRAQDLRHAEGRPHGARRPAPTS